MHASGIDWFICKTKPAGFFRQGSFISQARINVIILYLKYSCRYQGHKKVLVMLWIMSIISWILFFFLTLWTNCGIWMTLPTDWNKLKGIAPFFLGTENIKTEFFWAFLSLFKRNAEVQPFLHNGFLKDPGGFLSSLFLCLLQVDTDELVFLQSYAFNHVWAHH